MEPRTMTTTRGVTFTTTLTDAEAAAACNRIPATHADYGFARSLVTRFRNSNGTRLTDRQLPYLHIMAVEQLNREAAVVQPAEAAVETNVTVAAGDGVEPTVRPIAFTDEQREAAAALEPQMLFYDIPTKSGFPNPSWQLWRIGARINLSCWVVPKANIPYNLIGRIIEAGGVVHTIPFASAAAEKLLDLIAESLQRETAGVLERTEESMTHSIEKNGTRRETDKGIENARKRAEKQLGDLRASAAVFGLSLSQLPMNRALAQARVLQANAYVKATAYRSTAAKMKATGTNDGDAVARSVEEGMEVPVGIINDVLLEGGDDQSAEELRETFSDQFAPVSWS